MTTNPNEVKPSNASLEIVDAWLLQQGPELDRERLFSMCRLVDFALSHTSATSDAARLNFICNNPPRYVEHSTNGMYRVYQDYAGPLANQGYWQLITHDLYPTAREAIDAAMAAGGGQI